MNVLLKQTFFFNSYDDAKEIAVINFTTHFQFFSVFNSI